MNENKRYIDNGFEAIEDQSFTDIVTDKTYYVDYFDEIIDLLNYQNDKIEELQERNDRQRKRLDGLYQLILNRDYDGQEKWIKELEESERLLQEEWKCFE